MHTFTHAPSDTRIHHNGDYSGDCTVSARINDNEFVNVTVPVAALVEFATGFIGDKIIKEAEGRPPILLAIYRVITRGMKPEKKAKKKRKK